MESGCRSRCWKRAESAKRLTPGSVINLAGAAGQRITTLAPAVRLEIIIKRPRQWAWNRPMNLRPDPNQHAVLTGEPPAASSGAKGILYTVTDLVRESR